MPLTLAVAALTQTEQSQFISVLTAKSNSLTSAWTLFWSPSDFPRNPDAVIFCPKRADSALLGQKLIRSGAMPILAYPPLTRDAPEADFFLRMPFKPQEVVDVLNLAARKIVASRSEGPASKSLLAGPDAGDQSHPLPVALNKVFRSSSSNSAFIKLKRQGHAGDYREIWCWPEVGVYWSTDEEEELACDPDGGYFIWASPGGREALAEKGDELRSASSLLWRAGAKSLRPGELFPGLDWDMPLALLQWPDLPKDFRNLATIRILLHLARGAVSMETLHSELRVSRRELASCVNSLLACGNLKKSSAETPRPPPQRREAEEAMFLRSLALRSANELDESLAQFLVDDV